MKKVRFFDQNHGLTPLESIPFFDYINHIYLLCRTPSFLSKTSPNMISGRFLNKNTQSRKFKFLTKIMIFDQNHGLENIQFFDCMKYIFYSQSMLLFYLKHPQMSLLGLFSIKTNNEESSNF